MEVNYVVKIKDLQGQAENFELSVSEKSTHKAVIEGFKQFKESANWDEIENYDGFLEELENISNENASDTLERVLSLVKLYDYEVEATTK